MSSPYTFTFNSSTPSRTLFRSSPPCESVWSSVSVLFSGKDRHWAGLLVAILGPRLCGMNASIGTLHTTFNLGLRIFRRGARLALLRVNSAENAVPGIERSNIASGRHNVTAEVHTRDWAGFYKSSGRPSQLRERGVCWVDPKVHGHRRSRRTEPYAPKP